MIELRQVYHTKGDREILKGINLKVRGGETLALIGPTGAGKTTLLRLINLLERPPLGEIYFDGINTNAPEKVRLQIRRRMGVVSQKPVLFSASVYDNVAYGLRVRKEKPASLQQKVAYALETVGLWQYKNRQAPTLSGGEAQQVAIARAIVTEPQVLLLDEPSANLDPVSSTNIERLLSEVIKRLHTTVIMATHDLSFGQRLADRIAVIMGGELLQTGSPSEIFNQPQSRSIAQFVSTENILEGVITASEGGMVTVDVAGKLIEGISPLVPGDRVWVFIRPEEVIVALAQPSTSARNSFLGKIASITLAGPLARLQIDCGFPLVALVTKRSVQELDLRSGMLVYAFFKATGVHIIKW